MKDWKEEARAITGCYLIPGGGTSHSLGHGNCRCYAIAAALSAAYEQGVESRISDKELEKRITHTANDYHECGFKDGIEAAANMVERGHVSAADVRALEYTERPFREKP